MNNTYRISVKSPLLRRPGLSIETRVSERYVVPVTRKLMEMVREINTPVDAKED